MSNKRKQIYIVVIITCFLATGGVLYFGLKSPSVPPDSGFTPVSHGVEAGNSATSDTTSAAGGNGSSIYNTPKVFPADTTFDWSLLESKSFKTLKPIPNLVLDPNQVGRANPFGK